MQITHFSEIEEEFIQRVHTMVWCNIATVDSQGRPRSRLLHPIWEGATGWMGTHRNSYKRKHLAHNPYVSLAYITDIMNWLAVARFIQMYPPYNTVNNKIAEESKVSYDNS